MRTLRRILVASLTSLSVCGCGYVHHPAASTRIAGPAPDSHAAAREPALRWPRTWTEDLPTIHTAPSENTPPIQGLDGGAVAYGVLRQGARAQPCKAGWIVETGPADDMQGKPQTAPLSFGYYAWRDRPAALDNLSAYDPADVRGAELARLWALTASAPFHMDFRLDLPEERTPRGIVLYQWGLSGYRYEKELVRALTDRGWAVLSHNGLVWKRPGALTVTPEAPRPTPTPSSNGPHSGGLGRGEDRMAESKELYFEATAALAAAEFDDAVGQYALANEAALAFVRLRYPQIPAHPMAIVGCSFGAIMSPTVAARLGDSVDAVVLIGGGANFLDIAGAEWIDYYYSRVRGRQTTELHLNVADRTRVSNRYLALSTLDPYQTAVRLDGKPLLMLHASMDAIVPAKNGEILWNRAGKPERWIGNFGHLFMFGTLSWHADDIAEWLEHAVAPPKTGGPP